jgi:hypothetical protein
MPEQTEVLRTCLEAPGPDVRVVFCLREGAVLLEVSNAGRRLELYREDVTSGNKMSRRGQPKYKTDKPNHQQDGSGYHQPIPIFHR